MVNRCWRVKLLMGIVTFASPCRNLVLIYHQGYEMLTHAERVYILARNSEK